MPWRIFTSISVTHWWFVKNTKNYRKVLTSSKIHEDFYQNFQWISSNMSHWDRLLKKHLQKHLEQENRLNFLATLLPLPPRNNPTRRFWKLPLQVPHLKTKTNWNQNCQAPSNRFYFHTYFTRPSVISFFPTVRCSVTDL